MDRYSTKELKLIYRVLHQNLTKHLELLDSLFFEELQRHLQQKAQDEGVDISDHGAWDAWLGNEEVSCEDRVSRRSVL